MSTTFGIVTMNMKDGSVQGHAAGCADLKRGKAKFAEPKQAGCVQHVNSKWEAWEDYNSDFIAEHDHADTCDPENGLCDNAYEIEWLPCADHVPSHPAPAKPAKKAAAKPAKKAAAKPAKKAAAKLEMKNTGKYTRFYVGGKEVSYVPNELAAEIAKLLASTN